MISAENRYTLFSPAPGGGERNAGEISAVVSRTGAGEVSSDGVERSRVTASACVRRELAPDGGFVRGMVLVRGRERYRVLSAVLCSRLWVLRLERTVMDGEV